ncbi:hypothetical protein BPAE_0120g00140 [Botrytis paeoniae]|uniref:Uncharacterized protein n=1 Tax=Botrytis paeoniae TaxID=278948 RepID=A0A4Z1FHB6_9HELO|nr:hypothetical protein BPAE_0120g00140 [Botrytis paeoniae]
MSRLPKHISYFRNTPQIPQSPRDSIELDVVDANGRSLTPPRTDQMLHEIQTGVSGTVIAAIMSTILAVSWPGPSGRPDHQILALGDALHVLTNVATARYPLAGAENIILKPRRLTQVAVVSLVQEKSVVVLGAIAPHSCGEEIPQEPAIPHQTALDDRSNDFRQQLTDSIADLQKNLWSLIPIFTINFLAIFWTVNRIRRFTTPLENQKFTEGVLRLHWKRQTSGTCDSFDTRIKLSEPSVDYFGLHNRTTKEARIHINHLYSQTPGLYPYPSWRDYESYKSGIDLFNVTRINNTALRSPTLSTSKPFDQFWRIMGIYGDKPLHMDFDLLHRSWRMKEGIVIIDSEDPSSSFYKGGVLFDRLKPGEIYDSNKTAHLVPNFRIAIQNLHEVRNGTWTDIDPENPELVFPELDLHIPLWGLFEKHCVYQSFMRVFRRPTDEIRKTWNTWSKESNGEEVMRTASFGVGAGVGRRSSGAVGVDGCGEKAYEDGTGEDKGWVSLAGALRNFGVFGNSS